MEEQRDASNRGIPLSGSRILEIRAAQKSMRMPVVTSAHNIVHSAAHSSPTLGVAQPQVEFLQATIPRLHVGHEEAHCLNNCAVSLPAERPTCGYTSQGTCQYASQVLFDLLALDGEE